MNRENKPASAAEQPTGELPPLPEYLGISEAEKERAHAYAFNYARAAIAAPTTSTVSASGALAAPDDVRDAALEEAKKLCIAERDEFREKAAKNNGRESDFAFGSVNSAERIWAAIDTLKRTATVAHAATKSEG